MQAEFTLRIPLCISLRNGRINIFVMYLHRFLRLTPLLGISILLLMSLVKFLGNGPIWRNSIEMEIDTCQRSWWATLFYLNNYVRTDDMVCSSIHLFAQV